MPYQVPVEVPHFYPIPLKGRGRKKRRNRERQQQQYYEPRVIVIHPNASLYVRWNDPVWLAQSRHHQWADDNAHVDLGSVLDIPVLDLK